jgi:hypothetical protein
LQTRKRKKKNKSRLFKPIFSAKLNISMIQKRFLFLPALFIFSVSGAACLQSSSAHCEASGETRGHADNVARPPGRVRIVQLENIPLLASSKTSSEKNTVSDQGPATSSWDGTDDEDDDSEPVEDTELVQAAPKPSPATIKATLRRVAAATSDFDEIRETLATLNSDVHSEVARLIAGRLQTCLLSKYRGSGTLVRLENKSPSPFSSFNIDLALASANY